MREIELSAVVSKEEDMYVALCPDLDIASQGKTVEDSIANLKEALELYFEDEDAKIPSSKSSPMVTVLRIGLNEKVAGAVGA
jgi:predicted RNase H-like HicB family nuclease